MPRKMKTMDGNTAAAYVSYAFTDVTAIYPITPSTPMAESVDEWAAQGKKNLFGQSVKIIEMQSESGAAGAIHGALQAGALATTYTASQGLLLMTPNMYKIAGELLPAVFHVSARALATNSLNIFGDHQDVMAVRQTGCAMLAESSVQQVMDLAAVAHLAAIKGRIPFINFFDGFRTSHEIQKIEVLDYAELGALLDWEAVTRFRQNAQHPDHPVVRGTAQNPDIYFQEREASNKFYDALPEVVEAYMAQISQLTGREYHLFNYYGAADADRLIIAMGSVCETIQETVDYLNAAGEKVGVLTVHLYRPFSLKYFFKYIPKSVNNIAVLDRTKEPGSLAEPLYLDVKSAFYNSDWRPVIVGGRYALGGKDILPAHIISIYQNLAAERPKDGFTVGIVDDVTFRSLPAPGKDIDISSPGITACKFWGLGSDGTVGANKSAIKIIGDKTAMFAQAYFAYDSKKSGGVTMSHLRFGDHPITSPYLIHQADFISCSQQSYVSKYHLLAGLKPNGIFLLNCSWDVAELDDKLPTAMKRYIADNHIRFYIVNAVGIAQQLGLGGRFNMIMQAAFFKLADIIPPEIASEYLKQGIVSAYGNKGQKIIDMNNLAVDKGMTSVVAVTIPAAWKLGEELVAAPKTVPAFIKDILIPMNRQEGDLLPVSMFNGIEDGSFPSGTSAYEKRGVAINVPVWQMDKCTQCNQCAFICPHAAIRPVLLNEQELQNAPIGFDAKAASGAKGAYYRIAISPLDCSGCGNCADVCPVKGKALAMEPLESQQLQIDLWEHALALAPKANPMNKFTVKGSQFEQPLLEFSGACGGCGETPYAKLVTQLFGDRMMIANATGCSSIWGASAPSIPYTTNHKGQGPTWANSLFEDNAEFGLGMMLGVDALRDTLATQVNAALATPLTEELSAALSDWLQYKDLGEGTRERADTLLALLTTLTPGEAPLLDAIYANRDYLAKRSHWIFGGDGWAYDIGFGGLDHVLASGNDVNVLVFDTEVYSNTGGQSSKSTPAAAIAQFAANGKKTRKKDLGMMAMSYGYVYVAQVAMGADRNQTLRAIAEAEAYPGPSLIIAYAACINHGLRIGMGCSQREAKRAVEAGYWANYRYHPQLKDAGKNPFILDSDEPEEDFQEFLAGEVRYSSLKKQYPQFAESLFKKTEQDAKERLEGYKKLASS
ncbi:MAG: pyruvate:ferredoxin (flavodoxin) oxidoreductase [Rouxiella aceris]|uniref:pyruvate:ferredoxin (flavodoxin) oxidoreductase n=1 Tax=Rouxiella aceris TaxID=2703884 RepID=UPI00283DCE7E|nr:pyruvate:ferredoxin (flavodoxin) oxidoreductase [Rouxiella aceris]MDR3434848.1 pyruvate:ferredoxin (flavodoxin) oxidoreductase [Rouxiella aceris]